MTLHPKETTQIALYKYECIQFFLYLLGSFFLNLNVLIFMLFLQCVRKV